MTIPALMCPVCNVMTNDIAHCPYDGAQMVSFEPVSPSSEDEWLGRSILPSTPDDEGRYYILKRLGSGGFGHVYLAWHNELRRTVAIKISNRGRNTQGWRVGQQSMQNDGINAVLVEHPNVIRVYDSGSLGDRRYLVLEHLRGNNLETLCQSGISPPQAVDLIMQACRGLHAVHAARLVHRDVKLDNLFLHDPSPVSRPGADAPLVKVIDFGMTRPGFEPQLQVGGTPSYMAPEQFFRTARLDPRVDVYSLGISLFRLLTKTFPFRSIAEAESPGEAQFMAMMTQEPARPREVDPSIAISDELEEAIMTSISRVRERRFLGMSHFEAALAGTPEARRTGSSPSPDCCDLDEALSKRLPAVPGRPAIKIIYCSQNNSVKWKIPSSPPITLKIGKDRCIHTDDPYRIRVDGRNQTSVYIAPSAKCSMRICHRDGSSLYPLHALGWTTTEDGLLLDIGGDARLRVAGRHKGSLMALAAGDIHETVIICLA